MNLVPPTDEIKWHLLWDRSGVPEMIKALLDLSRALARNRRRWRPGPSMWLRL